MNYLLPLCPKFIKLRYENKIWITRSCVPFGSDACFCPAQIEEGGARRGIEEQVGLNLC